MTLSRIEASFTKMAHGSMGGESRAAQPVARFIEPSPGLRQNPCLEFICELEQAEGAPTGDITYMALSNDETELWVSMSEAGGHLIGRWAYPSGAFIATFGSGNSLWFDDTGELYWEDAYTDPGTDVHIRKGTTTPGSIIYSTGTAGDNRISLVWHDGHIFFTDYLFGRDPGNRICRIDDDGSNLLVIYDGDPDALLPLTVTPQWVWWLAGGGLSPYSAMRARLDGADVQGLTLTGDSVFGAGAAALVLSKTGGVIYTGFSSEELAVVGRRVEIVGGVSTRTLFPCFGEERPTGDHGFDHITAHTYNLDRSLKLVAATHNQDEVKFHDVWRCYA